jgi:indole-3-glycerol phosphate synthase
MSILQEILEVKKSEVKALRSRYRRSDFSDSEFFHKDKHSLQKALTKKSTISLIAEIKKASPSAGVIREDFNHYRIAQIYFQQGVDAISVLTDRNFFQGDISFLKDLAIINMIPILRKDFIIDEYQLFETKANGADAVLLIADALSQNQIRELSHVAQEVNLEILLELNSVKQINKIDFEKNKLIGINNRNLEDFSVNIFTTLEIAKVLPDSVSIVSESGISTKDDIERLKKAEIDAILVGEHFMKSDDIGQAVVEFKKWCEDES